MSRVHRNSLNPKKQQKKQSQLRLTIQLMTAVLLNGYIIGFAKGKLFTGKTKSLCVPVLNCYSCPGALGACPVGALQSIIGSPIHNFSFYVIGIIMLFGIVLGRLVCGFFCPFGLIQDLLFKVPIKKITISSKQDRLARFFKYVVALTLVLVLPIFATNQYGIAPPYFCKFVCPAGTLEGGLPLLISNNFLRNTVGLLFGWKTILLLLILLLSLFISRPFCKYICPLGAFYSLFNRFSIYQMKLNKTRCTNCKKCEHICPMTIAITQDINHTECIRCGKCKATCKNNAISSEFDLNFSFTRKRRKSV